MAETIPGGAYRRGDAWVDANGKTLSKELIAAAEQLVAERQQARDAAHRERMALEAQRDPTARAVAAALQPTADAASAKPPRRAEP